MNPMNGFQDHKLDDDAFGAKGSIVSAFDAFRKSHLSEALRHKSFSFRGAFLADLLRVASPSQQKQNHNT